MLIALVGTGNLLESLLAGALRAGVPRDWFRCSTRRAERAKELADLYDVASMPSNSVAVENAHLVIVGVPPTSLEATCGEILPRLRPGAVVAVATTPATLTDVEIWLPNVAVVRLMPTVTARVGLGICGIARGSRVFDEQFALVTTFFESMGEIQLLSENDLDPLDALAGSGPAYVAAVARALSNGGVELGLPAEEALRQSAHILRAVAALLADGHTPEQIAKSVGHPGGSTARSLAHLRKSGALAAVTAAVSHSFES